LAEVGEVNCLVVGLAQFVLPGQKASIGLLQRGTEQRLHDTGHGEQPAHRGERRSRLWLGVLQCLALCGQFLFDPAFRLRQIGS